MLLTERDRSSCAGIAAHARLPWRQKAASKWVRLRQAYCEIVIWEELLICIMLPDLGQKGMFNGKL